MKKSCFIIFIMFALSGNHISSASQESDITLSRRETRSIGLRLRNQRAAVNSTLNSGNNQYGEAPLHVAARNGNIEIITLLIKAGAFVDNINAIRQTPLHLAARNGNTKTVALLLEHGADADRIDIYGRTPLLLTNKPAVANLLIRAGADLECTEYRFLQNAPLC